ncbi:MAG: putative tellurium resistance membrane protein TerC [Planctomycetota bacterium]|jgi:predicted tellurium resistance membrane protein TerC
MTELFTTENLIAFLTLTTLEVVLGIDNLVFISILTSKLEGSQQSKARKLGLFLAMFMRIGLLLAIGWVMGLTKPLFDLFEHEFSGRSVILIVGGIFLIWKATSEIHEKVTQLSNHHERTQPKASFKSVIFQIVIFDAVFSLDSVITAVGMADSITVMVAAVLVAVSAMMIFADPVSSFIEKNPALKVLALSFLILIGVLLVAEGFDQHLERGYVYFAMAFSLSVELLNMKLRAKNLPPAEDAG